MSYRYDTRQDFDRDINEKYMIDMDIDIIDLVFWNKTQDNKKDENYKTTVIWQNVDFDIKTLHIFKNLFKKEFELEHDIKWIGVLITNKTPNVPNTGGRHDAAFLVHNNDLSKISNMHRIKLGFSWWEDVVFNGGLSLYPLNFRKNY